MENYFDYFSEIETHFQRRRGGPLIVSTLDWALIEVWKNAGVPLRAVLDGIDAAFDKYDQRKVKTRRVNSLAYCAQEVLSSAEQMKEAAVGSAAPHQAKEEAFPRTELAAYLKSNAEKLLAAKLPTHGGVDAGETARTIAASIQDIAGMMETPDRVSLEDVEMRLTVLEEKLFAALTGAVSEQHLLSARAEAEREIAPYRSKMPAAQIGELLRQFTQKRLLEMFNLPRLSLFYM